jgi:hypothetical protein
MEKVEKIKWREVSKYSRESSHSFFPLPLSLHNDPPLLFVSLSLSLSLLMTSKKEAVT